MKKTIRTMIAASLILGGCASPSSSTGASEVPAEENVLFSYVLTPGFSGENQISLFDLDETVKAYVMNAETKEFTETELTEEAIRGNFVQLSDTNGNDLADTVRIVSFEDADQVWDASMYWCDGAGEADPGISDEQGYDMFSKEYVIPYGERLLKGEGVGAWSGTVDNNNNDDGIYWSDNDYYNTTSSDTLTILTNYRTYLQPSSWTCGLASAVTVLDWYGLLQNLNCYDLANLRGIDAWIAGTNAEEEQHVLEQLEELGLLPEMVYETSMENPYGLFDPEWVQGQLAAGHPIMVVWDAFGGHWQVIIGYDNMGTEVTNDDVLIMMDPYDTTDHNANGYELESYERLIYGVSNAIGGGYTNTQFVCAYPKDFTYTPVMGEGIADDESNEALFTDEYKLSYGKTAEDLAKLYPDTEYVLDNGLAGAASVERSGDYNHSPYWKTMDFYNMESSGSLKILSGFETVQQATEWTCGTTCARMVLNWFDRAEDETDITLGAVRQNGEEGATYLEGLKEIFTYMNETYGNDFVWLTTEDLDDPDSDECYIGDYCLQGGNDPDWYGIIPYFIERGIPILAGSNEWGGHWQVIIGYDDMGTTDRTQDDVLIYADPYDTTDHNQDGYYIDSFERLVCDWYSSFEDTYKYNDFMIAFPASMCEEAVETFGLNK